MLILQFLGQVWPEVGKDQPVRDVVAHLPHLVRDGGVGILVGVAWRRRRDVGCEVARVALHHHVVGLDHAEDQGRVELEDPAVGEARPQEALEAVQALGVAEEGHGGVCHAPAAGLVHLRGHAHVAPGAPLGRQAGLAQGPAVAREAVKEGVGGRVVELTHVAVDRARGEHPEELEPGVLHALERLVQEERGSRLDVQHRLELLPRLVEEHRVLDDARRVDKARQPGSHGLDELVHLLLLAAIALDLLDRDPQLLTHSLDLLPIGHVPAVDLRRAGQELDGEALPSLLPGLVQQPDAKHEAHPAVATRDGNDAIVRHLEVRPILVGLRRHLPHHVPPAVEEADVVVAKGLVAEDLGDEVLGARALEGPLGVDELDRALDLQPSRVGHAEERRVRDEPDPALLVDLLLICKGVDSEDAQPLTTAAIVPDPLENVQVHPQDCVLLPLHVCQAVASRRVNASCKENEVPWVHTNEALYLCLCVLLRCFGLDVCNTNASRRCLVHDLLAESVAV
mmetsp:Transcript_33054/g.103099  ORF Transcript_33054/g.103099 Transcript_33054/m.103099 type:complete len:510 (+) Transcript_33054:533-2062(+)